MSSTSNPVPALGSIYRHIKSGRLYRVQSIAPKGKVGGEWREIATIHYEAEYDTGATYWRFLDDFLRSFEFVSY